MGPPAAKPHNSNPANYEENSLFQAILHLRAYIL
jgi:hypothetical protein